MVRGKKNPCVAIVSPGGYAPDEAGLARALARLAALGCKVKNFYDPAAKFQRFGASDMARVAQLHAAASDPQVDIVLALRGGYGISRLLPLLDFPMLAASGKLFVGHSDVTALHLALLNHGCPSFAGPMICDDFTREDQSEFTLADFWACLAGPDHVVQAAEGNPLLDVSGLLWGGNLAMLAHLTGSPWMPAVDGGILFIEDVNEHPYRVERMVLQLQFAGLLEKQQALLLGDFSNYKLSPYDNGYDFAAMLAYLRAEIGTPIVTGLPFGHIKDKVTLAVGSQARLEAGVTGIRLSMSGYPTL